jgi:very-short-patch-repair endonuclease
MNGVGRIAAKYGAQPAQHHRDAGIAQLAARQHGVVAVTQLRELGLTSRTARSRVATGRLHRLHRGVYAVGHPVISTKGRWMAAALACGGDAVLSHRSAAALWGIRPTTRTAIDVISPRRTGRGRARIEVHRPAGLRADDVTSVDGIPCTTVARTLLDLAGVVDRRTLERAYEQAEVLRLLDLEAVADVLARSSGRRGAAALLAVVRECDQSTTLTRNDLEERFLAICDAAALPRPRVNAWVPLDGGGVEVDFLWPRERLIIETDGHQVHGTRRAFERDRRRDRRLLLAGWRVVRFTWRQIVRDPDEVVATVGALLANGEGGIRTHEAANAAHAISSRAP